RAHIIVLSDCLLNGASTRPPVLCFRSHDVEVRRFRWSLAPASVGRWFLRLKPQRRFPFSSSFPYQKRLPATRLDFAGNRRTCYVKLLCNHLLNSFYDGNGRGGIRTHGGFPHARFRVAWLKPGSAPPP